MLQSSRVVVHILLEEDKSGLCDPRVTSRQNNVTLTFFDEGRRNIWATRTMKGLHFLTKEEDKSGLRDPRVTSRQNNETLTFFDKGRRQIWATRPEGDLEAEQCDAYVFRRRKKTNLGYAARG